MEIWLRQNKKSFRFAILPSEYELTSESDNTQVNINKLGEINLIGKRKLKRFPFPLFFRNKNTALPVFNIPNTERKRKNH